MEIENRISTSMLMADFLGWKKQVGLSVVYKLPTKFKSGLVDSDGKTIKYCSVEQLRFHESLDWMELVWNKIEKTKGKGAPFCVHLSDRYWGSHIDYFERGHMKPPVTIVSTVIRCKEWKDESNRRGVTNFFYSDSKAESLFISCAYFIEWAKKKGLIKMK